MLDELHGKLDKMPTKALRVASRPSNGMSDSEKMRSNMSGTHCAGNSEVGTMDSSTFIPYDGGTWWHQWHSDSRRDMIRVC